ncbi:MAG: hypothetical protein QOD89_673 [Bradyrhizobium sp.]|jgi:hypothetical protein|nr:hypothetical protein [Bradyrhizobium sp.]
MTRLHELLSSSRAEQWMEYAALVFQLLYAAFGLREVRQHLRQAWKRVIVQWRARMFGRLAVIGLSSILVALGPLYISLEAIQRGFS